MKTMKDRKQEWKLIIKKDQSNYRLKVFEYYLFTTILSFLYYVLSNFHINQFVYGSIGILYLIFKFMLYERIIIRSFNLITNQKIEINKKIMPQWAIFMVLLEGIISFAMSLLNTNMLLMMLGVTLLPLFSLLYVAFQNISFYLSNKYGNLSKVKIACQFVFKHIMELLSISFSYYFLNLGYNYIQNFLVQLFKITSITSKYQLFIQQNISLSLIFICLEFVYLIILSYITSTMFVAYADITLEREKNGKYKREN